MKKRRLESEGLKSRILDGRVAGLFLGVSNLGLPMKTLNERKGLDENSSRNLGSRGKANGVYYIATANSRYKRVNEWHIEN